MLLSNLHVKNYRGLRDVEILMSRFGCLIGENNAGKPSTLQALSLLKDTKLNREGASLSRANFFDESREIRITLTLDEVTDADLARLAPEHRQKVGPLLRERSITLVRTFDTDGKGRLKYLAKVPREERFSLEKIDELMKGQRPGNPFATKVAAIFPELSGNVTAAMNRDEVRAAIQTFADSFPDEQKQTLDMPLPTGIDQSVVALLPEILYIPAVKDLGDDVKTTQSTPFGKILGILLEAIEPILTAEKKIFEELNSKLNRIRREDGTIQDSRLDQIRLIEATVERYVRESFSNVAIEISIPPPELRTVLSNAEIFANDGVRGPIDKKGDGLRRAIVFSILRSFVELQRSGALNASAGAGLTAPQYLLLFEEPELYLHPKAQEILFDALSVFSQQHHVLVTTHSPMFFGPEATATFVKLRKKSDSSIAAKPFTCAYPIDLLEITAKDQFQLICYEHNNIAFFAETVVLVEGDSDYLVLPHFAQMIDPDWGPGKNSVRFARINGKMSIRRYRKFFEKFGTRVTVIADLDLLMHGFDQLNAPPEIVTQRSELIASLDHALNAAAPSQPSAREVGNAQERGDLRTVYRGAKQEYEKVKAGTGSMDGVFIGLDEFFAWERDDGRLKLLKNPPNDDIRTRKDTLLRALRRSEVFVLARGAIEDYYPAGITGQDKPSQAQSLCNTVTSRDTALALCDEIEIDGSGQKAKEFEAIFRLIFG